MADLTLDLLVRSGNLKGVALLAQENGVEDIESDPLFSIAHVESGITRAIDDIPRGWGQRSNIREYLDKAADYWASTTNTGLITQLVYSVYSGLTCEIEVEEQLEALDVLDSDCVQGAVERNIDSGNIRRGVSIAIQRAKLLLEQYEEDLAPEDRARYGQELVNNYSPIIARYEHLCVKVEPTKRSAQYVAEFNTFLAKLSKIDKSPSPERVAARKEWEARIEGISAIELVDLFVNSEFYLYVSNQEMCGPVGGDPEARRYLSEKMGQLILDGKYTHVQQVLKPKPTPEGGLLYDVTKAREVITDVLAQAIESRAMDPLDFALISLPGNLINLDDSRISDFAKAYRITQKTRECSQLR